ncbi:MAG: hypothetical protein M0D55_08305 [Elusimicrobiota bacterium]|nr:MAG: hypothetical protein M0D55_08305 [Elusimicrobiota bacterium]
MKILLAALLLLPAATVRADDEEPPAEEEQAAEPSAPSAPAPGSARRGGPSFSGAKPAPKRTAPGTIDADGAVGVGGAGLGRDESKPEKVYDRTQGLPAGAASAVGAAQAAAEAPVVKTTVYQSWKDVPPWKGNRSKWLVDFAGGPGTAFSVGFKAEGADGTFAFVEDINSTDACWYAAWISAKPGAYRSPRPAAIRTSRAACSRRSGRAASFSGRRRTAGRGTAP